MLSVRGEYDILLGELEKYNPELLDKARVVAVSKSDVLDGERMEEIEKVTNLVRDKEIKLKEMEYKRKIFSLRFLKKEA